MKQMSLCSQLEAVVDYHFHGHHMVSSMDMHASSMGMHVSSMDMHGHHMVISMDMHGHHMVSSMDMHVSSMEIAW